MMPKPFHHADYRALQLRVKQRLLRMHFESNVGHIGGNLSCLDMLLVLHHYVMRPEDRCVLAKGHSAGALYATLWSIGTIEESALSSFHKDNTFLAGHPAPNWHAGIPFATGSLGHGFSLSTGMALARTLEQKPGKIYCVMSDGEWQEGSNWEALIFAHHNQLDNLVVLVDANNLQGFGTTTEVASQPTERLIASLQGLGANLLQCNGHDGAALVSTLQAAAAAKCFTMIICHTVKGKGVPYMEHAMQWHYLPMNQQQFDEAIAATEMEA